MSKFTLADLIPLRAISEGGPKRIGAQLSKRTALRLASLGAVRIVDARAELTGAGRKAAEEYARSKEVP
jgi:hypothetical protein